MSRISQQTLDEITKPSLTARFLDTIAAPLDTAAKVLDTPGAFLRGLLHGDSDRAFGGLFDPSRRVSGAELLGNPKDKFTWGGLGAEILLDPLNLVGIGELTGVGKLGLRASKLATRAKALEAAGKLEEAAATRKALLGLGEVGQRAALGESTFGKTFAEQGLKGERSLLNIGIPFTDINTPITSKGLGGFTLANKLLGKTGVPSSLGKLFNPYHGYDPLQIELKKIHAGDYKLAQADKVSAAKIILDDFKTTGKKLGLSYEKYNEFLHDALELSSVSPIHPEAKLYDVIPEGIKQTARRIQEVNQALLVSGKDVGISGLTQLGTKYGYDPRYLTPEAYEWLAKDKANRRKFFNIIKQMPEFGASKKRTAFRNLRFNELNDAARKKLEINFDLYSNDVARNISDRVYKQKIREADIRLARAATDLYGKERAKGLVDSIKLYKDSRGKLITDKFKGFVKDKFNTKIQLDETGRVIGTYGDDESRGRLAKLLKQIRKTTSQRVISRGKLTDDQIINSILVVTAKLPNNVSSELINEFLEKGSLPSVYNKAEELKLPFEVRDKLNSLGQEVKPNGFIYYKPFTNKILHTTTLNNIEGITLDDKNFIKGILAEGKLKGHTQSKQYRSSYINADGKTVYLSKSPFFKSKTLGFSPGSGEGEHNAAELEKFISNIASERAQKIVGPIKSENVKKYIKDPGRHSGYNWTYDENNEYAYYRSVFKDEYFKVEDELNEGQLAKQLEAKFSKVAAFNPLSGGKPFNKSIEDVVTASVNEGKPLGNYSAKTVSEVTGLELPKHSADDLHQDQILFNDSIPGQLLTYNDALVREGKMINLGRGISEKEISTKGAKSINEVKRMFKAAGFTNRFVTKRDYAIFDKMLRIPRIPEAFKPIADFLDTTQGIYRMFLTTLIPAYHGRNAYSGAFMNALAGMNPLYYADAIKDIFSGKIDNHLREIGVIGKGLHAESAELIKGSGFSRLTNNPLSRTGLKAAETIDNINRLALYKDRIAKGLTPREAADEVIKFHFDYDEVTGFEKHVARRTLLFYTFFRKAIPLMMKQMAENKNFVMAYARATGKTNTNIEQPSWLPDSFFGGDNTRISLGLPLDELSKYGTDGKGVQRLGQLLLTQFNPLLTGIVEGSTNYNLYFDRPLEGGTLSRLGDLSPLSRFIGIAERAQNDPMKELLRTLTGVTVRDIPKDQKRLNNIGNLKRKLQDLAKSGEAKQFSLVGQNRGEKNPEVTLLNSLLTKLEKQ